MEKIDLPAIPFKLTPQAVSWVLGFKEKQKYIYGCGQPQMVAHHLECSHKRPAVGMKLGGGDVELGKELPFETGEREFELHLLE